VQLAVLHRRVADRHAVHLVDPRLASEEGAEPPEVLLHRVEIGQPRHRLCPRLLVDADDRLGVLGLRLPDHVSSSASGNERCRRGGTRKFWRWVVRRIELNPWPRSRGANGSFVPSGSTPSIARRPRLKSSLDGLKTTKWTPAAAPSVMPSRSGAALQANGLSSVLKSARCGIAVPGP